MQTRWLRTSQCGSIVGVVIVFWSMVLDFNFSILTLLDSLISMIVTSVPSHVYSLWHTSSWICVFKIKGNGHSITNSQVINGNYWIVNHINRSQSLHYLLKKGQLMLSNLSMQSHLWATTILHSLQPFKHHCTDCILLSSFSSGLQVTLQLSSHRSTQGMFCI